MNRQPEHRTILLVDIEGYGRWNRTNPIRRELRAELRQIMEEALNRSGIAPSAYACHDLGDGFAYSFQGQISKLPLLASMIPELSGRLSRRNSHVESARQIRLRVALHAGEVLGDPAPFQGDAMILASRLLDAEVLRTCLARIGAPLALIVSERIQTEIVQQGYDGVDRDTYHLVQIQTKEGRRTPQRRRTQAWIHVPGEPGVATLLATLRPPVTDPGWDEPVGRERDLGQLRAALLDARDGKGRLLLISGEAGTGKTHLVTRLIGESLGHGLVGLSGWAWEEEGASTLWAWIKILRASMTNHTSDELRNRLGPDAAVLRPLDPWFAEQLAGMPDPPALDPEQDRFRLLNTIIRWLHAVVERQPTLVVIEDVHRADVPSLLLLELLSHSLPTMPMLLVATYRDSGEAKDQTTFRKTLAELIRKPVTSRIHLDNLNRPQVADLIALETGAAPEPDLATAVYERTGGNPLFTRELVRLLHAQGRLDRVAPENQLGSDELPQSIKDVV